MTTTTPVSARVAALGTRSSKRVCDATTTASIVPVVTANSANTDRGLRVPPEHGKRQARRDEGPGQGSRRRRVRQRRPEARGQDRSGDREGEGSGRRRCRQGQGR